MEAPPKVGDRILARLADGRTWDGQVVRFSEVLGYRDDVERLLVLSLDPERNANLGPPNAGRYPDASGRAVPHWHRKLTATTEVGMDYDCGWRWLSRGEEIDVELEPKE